MTKFRNIFEATMANNTNGFEPESGASDGPCDRYDDTSVDERERRKSQLAARVERGEPVFHPEGRLQIYNGTNHPE